MNIGSPNTYDDYNEYADHLAAYLVDRIDNDYPEGISIGLIYSWIQEFNKSLEKF